MASSALDIAPYAVKHAEAKCCECNRKPDSVEFNALLSEDVLEVAYFCHGKVDVVRIPGIRRMALTQNFGTLIDAIPRQVFLRRWAEYKTTTKLERRKVGR